MGRERFDFGGWVFLGKCWGVVVDLRYREFGLV